MTRSDALTKFGTYALPGRVSDPARAPIEAAQAEALGLGTIWLSDRRDMKEGGVVCGAMAQATSQIRLGTAVTHVGTRHPQVLAAIGSTMQGLSGGRFRMGFGRSVPQAYHALGLPPPSIQAMRDNADMLRRLWAGEAVSYRGPLGSFQGLRMGALWEGDPPPIYLAGAGPRTLAVAGEVYDGALLEPVMNPQAVSRCARLVRDAAARARRDPASLKVIPVVIVAPELSDQDEARILGGRMVTYLQNPGTGERKVAINGWDPAVLETVRNHPLFGGHGHEFAYADRGFTLDQLAEVAKVIPRDWLRNANVAGRVSECARKLREYLDAGADEIILHGSSPEMLKPLVEELARTSSDRPVAR